MSTPEEVNFTKVGGARIGRREGDEVLDEASRRDRGRRPWKAQWVSL